MANLIICVDKEIAEILIQILLILMINTEH